jgi:hypothetical protein
MTENASHDPRPWLVWLALAVDPMTAAVVLATHPRPPRTTPGEQR